MHTDTMIKGLLELYTEHKKIPREIRLELMRRVLLEDPYLRRQVRECEPHQGQELRVTVNIGCSLSMEEAKQLLESDQIPLAQATGWM